MERAQAGPRNAPRVGSLVRDAVRIARLREQERTAREIADELGYSRSLVHKTLANGESRRVAIATT